MKLEDVKVGMRVRGQNMFGCLYRVTKIDGRRVGLEHRTGNLVMRGGKRVDEVLTYWAHPRILTPVVDATSEESRMARDAASAMADICGKMLAEKWLKERCGDPLKKIADIRAEVAELSEGLTALEAEMLAERAAKKNVERVPCNLSAGLVSRREALVPFQMEGLPAYEVTRKRKPGKSKKRKE